MPSPGQELSGKTDDMVLLRDLHAEIEEIFKMDFMCSVVSLPSSASKKPSVLNTVAS